MSLKKIGFSILAVGILLLVIAIFMIFCVRSSPWALVLLGLSIVVNTAGTLCILRK